MYLGTVSAVKISADVTVIVFYDMILFCSLMVVVLDVTKLDL